ncbi:molybdopterin molybdotransferase MoeA [Nocardiopsis sp. RSe5-2]|uniref:Molybdopterin molybdenumtransferase n=1 Tax=Nocardiopsis endophytica TaxID=3018445 RepID=A0ABT4UB65_9ACTN|nr:molybdopterin molybdotransferase MoeA [Nocardiopsis endophytica]MDA2814210.1 molybdopterin molybdotransferase MoeA [Nocardiopsis endophytica]
MARREGATAAWDRARAAARELGERTGPSAPRRVPLAEALGATLAADLPALVGIPDCDTSAMDGYAVCGPGPWRVTGRVLAGAAPTADALAPGTAVEIATGAPVPPGTTSVLPYEHAREEGGGAVSGETEPDRHVRRAGEDTRPGDVVLKQGAPVTPAVLGLAASLGHDALRVRRPVLAVLVTGDEVVRTGVPGPGRVRDAIGPMLPGLADWAGARAEPPVFLGDVREGLADALRSAAGSGPDAVAVCGASSKGPADHLRSALGDLGAETVVDGVACRPGHPQLLARLPDGPAVVGLPGNPGAALVAAVTLLAPLLSALAGRPDPAAAAPGRAELSAPVRPHPVDTRLVAVRLTGSAAEPVGHDRPGSLRSPAAADGYAVIPPGWSGPLAEIVRLPR